MMKLVVIARELLSLFVGERTRFLWCRRLLFARVWNQSHVCVSVSVFGLVLGLGLTLTVYVLDLGSGHMCVHHDLVMYL